MLDLPASVCWLIKSANGEIVAVPVAIMDACVKAIEEFEAEQKRYWQEQAKKAPVRTAKKLGKQPERKKKGKP